MADLIATIKTKAQKLLPELIRCRRYLHAHPELSFHEQETAQYLKNYLTQKQITWRSCGQNGILATLPGHTPAARSILLRADIDALPILEKNQLDYASTRPGVMHACGHDGHTAMLLGVISLLTELHDVYSGTVHCIFQPAEEKIPGGALEMIADGVLADPHLELVLGQHVMPSLAVGQVAMRPGLFTASADEVVITVRGKGGHAAQPHTVIDPLLIAAHLLVALQQIVSRQANPATPSVLSFGRCVAEGAINVIPDEVRLEGTFRTLDESWRKRAHEQIRTLAEQLALGMGGSCTVDIRRGYPSIINDQNVYDQIKGYAQTYLGAEQVLITDPWMAAEDFAYYTQQKPGLFYLLGSGNAAKGVTSALHTATFNLDEDALAIGTGLMTFCAMKMLGVEGI